MVSTLVAPRLCPTIARLSKPWQLPSKQSGACLRRHADPRGARPLLAERHALAEFVRAQRHQVEQHLLIAVAPINEQWGHLAGRRLPPKAIAKKLVRPLRAQHPDVHPLAALPLCPCLSRMVNPKPFRITSEAFPNHFRSASEPFLARAGVCSLPGTRQRQLAGCAPIHGDKNREEERAMARRDDDQRTPVVDAEGKSVCVGKQACVPRTL